MSYAIHPLAECIPEMDAEQYAGLREDILRHGLNEPIVLHEHMVLDGRHRLRACEELDIVPRFREFDGPSAIDFVLSANVKRRHLTSSQLAAIAVEFLPMLEAEAKERQRFHAGTAPNRPSEHFASKEEKCRAGQSSTQAGAKVGVSRASVERAKRIQKEEPEVFEQVKAGTVTVTAAETAIRERNAATSQRTQDRANAHKRRVIELASALKGFANGVGSVDLDLARAAMEPAELEQWIRSLGDSLSKLRQFRLDLQDEGRNR